MISHPALSLLWIDVNETKSRLAPLITYLQSMPHVRLSVVSSLPTDLDDIDCVISSGDLTGIQNHQRLENYVGAGGGWLNLIDLSADLLPEIFGVAPDQPGPETELRALFTDAQHSMAARLPDAIYVKGCYHGLQVVAVDIEILMYVDYHYEHTPVMAGRFFKEGRLACTTLQDYSHPVLQRILYRLLLHLAGRNLQTPQLGVGILGYAPSMGRLHGLGAMATKGFELRGICDHNELRYSQAKEDFPDVHITTSADALAADPRIDLVIVATAPSSHAQLCLQLMAAGKHVVCEKPLALNTQETEALQEVAIENKVHLSCHQNRRWDPDYLAIRHCLLRGDIGDLFYLETFVGGYHHPCGYWHSHAPVSGGTSYDWGAHYIDWIVSLINKPVLSVIGTRHKRVWHDVTNADQERIQICFEGGIEAEFIHSDIAAARKPKWYLLGTGGAIVGDWQDIRSHEIDPDHYYRAHDIPTTEMTPELTIFQRRAEGEIMQISPAVTERIPFSFHNNLADHLLLGEPIVAPLEDSVRVVEILEAAALSMEQGGTVERIYGF